MPGNGHTSARPLVWWLWQREAEKQVSELEFCCCGFLQCITNFKFLQCHFALWWGLNSWRILLNCTVPPLTLGLHYASAFQSLYALILPQGQITACYSVLPSLMVGVREDRGRGFSTVLVHSAGPCVFGFHGLGFFSDIASPPMVGEF